MMPSSDYVANQIFRLKDQYLSTPKTLVQYNSPSEYGVQSANNYLNSVLTNQIVSSQPNG